MNPEIIYAKLKALEEQLVLVEESDSVTDETGTHHYEKYSNGTAKAWGTAIITTDFQIPLGDFHRAEDSFSFGNLIDFDSESVHVLAYVDDRTTDVNIQIMTASNTDNLYSDFRLLAVNPSAVSERTVYVNYHITGTAL